MALQGFDQNKTRVPFCSISVEEEKKKKRQEIDFPKFFSDVSSTLSNK